MGQGTEGREQQNSSRAAAVAAAQQLTAQYSTARQGLFQGYSMASRIPRQEKDESS